MNREFEFKQLLRALRSGIISEAAFEQEMGRLETDGSPVSNGAAGFRAFGKTYKSERAAVVSFIDKVCAAEANAAEAFNGWADVCTTDCLRTGLRMVAEREAYHARIFERRMRELGAEPRAGASEEGRKLKACLIDAKRGDAEKLTEFMRGNGDPEDVVKPINEFAALLHEGVETKEALRLFCEDEYSTLKWMRDACAALNAAPRSTASAGRNKSSGVGAKPA